MGFHFQNALQHTDCAIKTTRKVVHPSLIRIRAERVGIQFECQDKLKFGFGMSAQEREERPVVMVCVGIARSARGTSTLLSSTLLHAHFLFADKFIQNGSKRMCRFQKTRVLRHLVRSQRRRRLDFCS